MKLSPALLSLAGFCLILHVHWGFPPAHILINDEAFTWRLVVSSSLTEVIARSAEDVHPPFYYILLWFWTGVWGLGEIALRSLSGLCSVATVIAVYWYTGLWTGSTTVARSGPLLAAVLVALCVPQVIYGQLARMYALLGLLTVLCSGTLFLAVRNPLQWKWWALVGVLATGLAYTHNYGLLFVGCSACWIVLEGLVVGNFRVLFSRAVVTFGIVLLLYVPWLTTLWWQVSQVRGGYWIPELEWACLAALPVQFLLPPLSDMPSLPAYAVALLFSATALALYPWQGTAAERHIAFLFGLHVLAFAAAPFFLGRSVFIPRYLVHLLPLFASVVAVRLAWLAAGALGPALLYLVPFSLASWLAWIVTTYASTGPPAMKQMVAHLVRYAQPEDTIIVNDYSRYLVFRYYFDKERPAQPCFLWDFGLEQSETRHVVFAAAFLPDEIWTAADARAATPGRYWVVGAELPLPEAWVKTGEGSFFDWFPPPTVMRYSEYIVKR